MRVCRVCVNVCVGDRAHPAGWYLRSGSRGVNPAAAPRARSYAEWALALHANYRFADHHACRPLCLFEMPKQLCSSHSRPEAGLASHRQTWWSLIGLDADATCGLQHLSRSVLARPQNVQSSVMPVQYRCWTATIIAHHRLGARETRVSASLLPVPSFCCSIREPQGDALPVINEVDIRLT